MLLQCPPLRISLIASPKVSYLVVAHSSGMFKFRESWLSGKERLCRSLYLPGSVFSRSDRGNTLKF